MSDYTSLLTSERLAKTYSELLKKRPIMEEGISHCGTGQITRQPGPVPKQLLQLTPKLRRYPPG